MSRVTVILVSTGALVAVVMLSVAAMSRDPAAGVPRSERGARPRTSAASSSPSRVVVKPGGPLVTTNLAAATTSAPTTALARAGATSQPTTAVLPPEFAIFQTRSPFAKGPKKPPAAAGGPEASFVLKGAVDVGGRMTAFVEDLSAKRVLQLAAGQSLAGGRVKGITLDGIEYEAAAGAPARRIEVGQNLMGQVVPPTPTSKPAAGPPGQPGAPGQPGTPGAPPQPGMPPGAVRGKVVAPRQAMPAPGQ
jgi:hypothetical protein